MRGYRYVFRAIDDGEPRAVNFLRWNRRGSRVNNPVRIWPVLESHLTWHREWKYFEEDFYDKVFDVYSARNDKFPQSYFQPVGFSTPDDFSRYLRDTGVIAASDVADCIERMATSALDEPLKMFHAFCTSEGIVSQSPYSDFVSPSGQLDAVKFVKAIPEWRSGIPRSQATYLLQKLLDYEKADAATRTKMLKDDLGIFERSIRFASGFDSFKDGLWPSASMFATFRGYLKASEGRAVVEMGKPLWYLRHPKIIDIATDLNATTKIVAEVLRRLGIADDVDRRGRIFYDACVINRYRFRDKSLFAGRQNAGFKLVAEYADIDMNPWLS